MKFVLLIFSLAISIHSSRAVFGFKSYLEQNDKYKLHKEPPIPSSPNDSRDTIYEGWVRQRLDNFDPQNQEYFYMRYLMNMNYLQEGSPIFIYVGGEWTISSGAISRGHMYDMAQNLSGLMIYTEHRYYGYTIPTPDLSLENMQYLNIDQALADLAYFISYIKENIPQVRNSGVILTGCSYAGTMVTWFQQKYPHLINGAWAQSGPLLAQVDFIEYQEVVSHAIEEVGGPDCSSRIRNAFQQLEVLVWLENAPEIERLFRLCEPLNFTNQLDVWSLFGDTSGPWSGIVQYYHRADRDIEDACDDLIAIEAESDLEAYATWVMNRWRITGERCYNHTWASFLDDFSGIEWSDWVALAEWRQWLYQTCSEYGWYQSSGSENILFGSKFPVEMSLQWCQDLYDGFFTPEIVHELVDRTNVIYGAKHPAVRNVYSTHGEYDPWSPMGVLTDINEDSPVVILPGESHCSDSGSINSVRDSPETIESKHRVFDLVRKWLRVSDISPEKK